MFGPLIYLTVKKGDGDSFNSLSLNLSLPSNHHHYQSDHNHQTPWHSCQSEISITPGLTADLNLPTDYLCPFLKSSTD